MCLEVDRARLHYEGDYAAPRVVASSLMQARPWRLAAYMAASARRISSLGSRNCPGPAAARPMLNVGREGLECDQGICEKSIERRSATARA